MGHGWRRAQQTEKQSQPASCWRGCRAARIESFRRSATDSPLADARAAVVVRTIASRRHAAGLLDTHGVFAHAATAVIVAAVVARSGAQRSGGCGVRADTLPARTLAAIAVTAGFADGGAGAGAVGHAARSLAAAFAAVGVRAVFPRGSAVRSVAGHADRALAAPPAAIAAGAVLSCRGTLLGDVVVQLAGVVERARLLAAVGAARGGRQQRRYPQTANSGRKRYFSEGAAQLCRKACRMSVPA